MAVDKLRSEQKQLCIWLSDDPEFILEQCGNILYMKEYKEADKQNSAIQKMKVLLGIIIEKGEDVCQEFIDILRQHQTHYQQLQQFFNPNTQGSHDASVFADSNSIVTRREISNIEAKSLSMTMETESHPGSSQSGNTERQIVPACYTARNGSIVCVDKISGARIDGDVNLSASIKTSRSATVNEKPLPSQEQYMEDPVVRMIINHKVELIDCLRADCNFILQHVHARHIVTDIQYQNLKCIPEPEKSIINLIDLVTGKGQESCSSFRNLLKEPDILKTYPQLKEITKKLF